MQTDQADIAELAFASTSAAAFRRDVLAWLDDHIGFDVAALNGATDLAWRGYSEAEARDALARSPEYMAELAPAEIRAAAGTRPMLDVDVIPRSRRERLGIYRDLLARCRVSTTLLSLWGNAHGAFGLHLARTGRAGQFRPRDVDRLAACLPAVRLADAYVVARDRATRPERAFTSWADAVGLTRTERDIAALAIRGLQNREIAHVLRRSPLTVRNHLASIFRKAEVTTRSELAYVCASDEPALPDPAWVRHLRAARSTR